MSAPLFVIRAGYRAEWKPAGERPVTVCCRTEMFDPGPIIAVTGPGITGAFEVSANAYEGLDQSDILKIQQLEQAAYYCAERFTEHDL